MPGGQPPPPPPTPPTSPTTPTTPTTPIASTLTFKQAKIILRNRGYTKKQIDRMTKGEIMRKAELFQSE